MFSFSVDSTRSIVKILLSALTSGSLNKETRRQLHTNVNAKGMTKVLRYKFAVTNSSQNGVLGPKD